MYLKSLTLQNYRNYSDLRIEFNKCGNLLFGKNGQGKTNLLESVYYLSVFRSFRRGSSRDLVGWGSEWFRINGFFDTERSLEREIEVSWEKGGQKQVLFEKDRVSRLADMIGSFPVILLSPESVEITQGQPGERRRFMDLCFSMVDKEYLNKLISYRKVLRQRNTVLYRSVPGSFGFDEVIAPWDEKLVEYGTYLIRYREQMVHQFSDICREMYEEISSGSERFEMTYRSGIGDEISEERYRECLVRNRDEEFRRKTTVTGPHRDELVLQLDGHDARKFGSQGQHKTILLALKAAEVRYIHEKKETQPAILLDDLFAMLDRNRIMSFLKILTGFGQFFITANVELDPGSLLSEAGFSDGDFSQFEVRNGVIEKRM